MGIAQWHFFVQKYINTPLLAVEKITKCNLDFILTIYPCVLEETLYTCLNLAVAKIHDFCTFFFY